METENDIAFADVPVAPLEKASGLPGLVIIDVPGAVVLRVGTLPRTIGIVAMIAGPGTALALVLLGVPVHPGLLAGVALVPFVGGMASLAGWYAMSSYYGTITFQTDTGVVEFDRSDTVHFGMSEVIAVQACAGWIFPDTFAYQVNLIRLAGGKTPTRYCLASSVRTRRSATRMARALSGLLDVPFLDHALARHMALHDPEGLRRLRKVGLAGVIALAAAAIMIFVGAALIWIKLPEAPLWGVFMAIGFGLVMACLTLFLLSEARAFFAGWDESQHGLG